ncbi:hypothetical protein PR202_gb17606 [Eleusine coracana subsp. coracana]|uniref:Uncharacterized protein n=1 Tax=Eleusine coracana subsp. coracana TaxID=191504 RepID=A0AAV5F3F2_ELECO|nr:hypothetical protein PR202_gb17606 [Eleusine coracana subsp. coracana]
MTGGTRACGGASGAGGWRRSGCPTAGSAYGSAPTTRRRRRRARSTPRSSASAAPARRTGSTSRPRRLPFHGPATPTRCTRSRCRTPATTQIRQQQQRVCY